MKRIIQILVSVVFVVTILTLYLAVDFLISNATPAKGFGHRRGAHDRANFHPPDEIKISRKRSVPPPALLPPRDLADPHPHPHHSHHRHQERHDELLSNGTDHDRLSRKSKDRPRQAPPKARHFHKGKTGIKLNRVHPGSAHRRSHSNATKGISPHIVRQGELAEQRP